MENAKCYKAVLLATPSLKQHNSQICPATNTPVPDLNLSSVPIPEPAAQGTMFC